MDKKKNTVAPVSAPTNQRTVLVETTPKTDWSKKKKEKVAKPVIVENIPAPKIEANFVTIGKIELPQKLTKKAEPVPVRVTKAEKPKVKIFPWRNFPIAFFTEVQKLCHEACKTLGYGVVTASKKCILNGAQDDTKGTVFITCHTDEKFIRTFGIPYNILVAGLFNNSTRCTKDEFLNIDYGKTFYVAMLNNRGFSSITKCMRVFTNRNNDKLGVSYVSVKRASEEPMFLEYDSISGNATFEGSDGFTGYVFLPIVEREELATTENEEDMSTAIEKLKERSNRK